MSKIVKTENEVTPIGDLLREITNALDAEAAEASEELVVRAERKSLFDGVAWDYEEPSLTISMPVRFVAETMTWAMSIFGKSVL